MIWQRLLSLIHRLSSSAQPPTPTPMRMRLFLRSLHFPPRPISHSLSTGRRRKLRSFNQQAASGLPEKRTDWQALPIVGAYRTKIKIIHLSLARSQKAAAPESEAQRVGSAATVSVSQPAASAHEFLIWMHRGCDHAIRSP